MLFSFQSLELYSVVWYVRPSIQTVGLGGFSNELPIKILKKVALIIQLVLFLLKQFLKLVWCEQVYKT